MPKKTFYLNAEKTETINISWGFSWKNTSITYNGHEIGSFKNQKELKEGNEFMLDSSRILSVKLSGTISPELDISINNEPIEGSPTNPKHQLKQISNLAIGLGIFSIVIGLFSELLKIEILINLGFGIGSILIGGIVIGLGFGVRKHSLIALSLIFGIIILDIISSYYVAANSEIEINPTNGVVIKVFLLIYIFKGFSAIRKIKNKNNTQLAV